MTLTGITWTKASSTPRTKTPSTPEDKLEAIRAQLMKEIGGKSAVRDQMAKNAEDYWEDGNLSMYGHYQQAHSHNKRTVEMLERLLAITE